VPVCPGVRGDRLADAAPPRRFPASEIDGERMDRLAWAICPGTATPRDGRASNSRAAYQAVWVQHDIAIFPALALFIPDDDALAVDRRWREVDGFGNSQTDGQHYAVLQVIHGIQESRHLFVAQYDRQLPGLKAGGDILHKRAP
jgi:hypothetical protein